MRLVSLLIGLACLLTTALLRTAAAQVSPGDRVRVTTPDRGRYDGTLVALPPDSIVVDTLRISLVAVTQLELHHGQKSKWATGAIIGGVALGAATAAVVIAGCDPWGSHEEYCSISDAGFVAVTAAGAVAGAAIGGAFGALSKSDRWEEVPLDQLRVSFAPQRDGRFAFGLSMRF
jgi:hypothetical protein